MIVLMDKSSGMTRKSQTLGYLNNEAFADI